MCITYTPKSEDFMQKILLSTIIVIFVALTACSNNDSNDSSSNSVLKPSQSDKRLIKITISGDKTAAFTLEYDSNGFLKTVTNDNNQNNYITYAYKDGFVSEVALTYDQDESIKTSISKYTYSKGRIKSIAETGSHNTMSMEFTEWNSENPENLPSNGTLSFVNEDGTELAGTMTIIFNDENKAIKMTAIANIQVDATTTTSVDMMKETYAYSNNTITTNSYDYDGSSLSPRRTKIFTFEGDKIIKIMEAYADSYDGNSYLKTSTYTYDAEGYLTSVSNVISNSNEKVTGSDETYTLRFEYANEISIPSANDLIVPKPLSIINYGIDKLENMK